MTKIVGILLFTFLISCTPQQRLNRLVRKNPHLATSTIEYRTDTIVTSSVSIDTVFNHFHTRDTITLQKDNLTVKYFYNTKDSTIYLSGKCDTITIIRDVPILVTNIEAKDTKWDIFKRFFVGNLLTILLILFLFLLWLRSRR